MRAVTLMAFAVVSVISYWVTRDDTWFLATHIYLAAYIALPLPTSKQAASV